MRAKLKTFSVHCSYHINLVPFTSHNQAKDYNFLLLLPCYYWQWDDIYLRVIFAWHPLRIAEGRYRSSIFR